MFILIGLAYCAKIIPSICKHIIIFAMLGLTLFLAIKSKVKNHFLEIALAQAKIKKAKY
jgi:hypothetical protein